MQLPTKGSIRIAISSISFDIAGAPFLSEGSKAPD
jgi:hypothetical protein